MSKVLALEEMYYIYQAAQSYLADVDTRGEEGLAEIAAAYHDLRQREPLGSRFLEAVLTELLEQARSAQNN